MVICLGRGADLHMAQLMPLPLTVSCFSKIQIGFTFLVPAHVGSLGNGPLNVCVRVCVRVLSRWSRGHLLVGGGGGWVGVPAWLMQVGRSSLHGPTLSERSRPARRRRTQRPLTRRARHVHDGQMLPLNATATAPACTAAITALAATTAHSTPSRS